MIICLKWCWISLSCEVLYAYSFSPMSLIQPLWAIWSVPVQHHLQYFIQLWSVKLKHKSLVCFLIPRNTITLWLSLASFSVTFSSQDDDQQTASFLPPLPGTTSVLFCSPLCTNRTNKRSINEESVWNMMTGNYVALLIWGPKRQSSMQRWGGYTACVDITKSSSVSVV